MATRAKATRKQVKPPRQVKKSTEESPARILLPSGVTDGDEKKSAPKKKA